MFVLTARGRDRNVAANSGELIEDTSIPASPKASAYCTSIVEPSGSSIVPAERISPSLVSNLWSFSAAAAACMTPRMCSFARLRVDASAIDQQTLGRASRIAGGFPSSRVVNGSVGLGE